MFVGMSNDHDAELDAEHGAELEAPMREGPPADAESPSEAGPHSSLGSGRFFSLHLGLHPDLQPPHLAGVQHEVAVGQKVLVVRDDQNRPSRFRLFAKELRQALQIPAVQPARGFVEHQQSRRR